MGVYVIEKPRDKILPYKMHLLKNWSSCKVLNIRTFFFLKEDESGPWQVLKLFKHIKWIDEQQYMNYFTVSLLETVFGKTRYMSWLSSL